jgi:hypothetical protein
LHNPRQVGPRRLLYPVEAHGVNPSPHDGVWKNGVCGERQPSRSEETLVLASCDPGAGILATAYGREMGFRLLVFPRAGLAALELLRQGLIHVAALHRSTPNAQQRNARTVRERLGDDFQLLRAADWEEGLVVRAELAKGSVRSPKRLVAGRLVNRGQGPANVWMNCWPAAAWSGVK